MTTLLADDFNRTLSGTWGNSSHGEAWTQRLGASNQLACNGTQGKIDNTTAGRVIMAIGSALSDVEVTVTATPGTSDSEIGVNARLQAGNLSYYSFRVNGTAGGALIYRIDNGTATQIAGISAFPLSPGTAYDLKFQVIGSALKAKVWQHGQAEPGTWLFSVTDTTYASGGCGIVAIPQNATGVLFDNFLVTDGTSITNNPMNFTTVAPISDQAAWSDAPNLTDLGLISAASQTSVSQDMTDPLTGTVALGEAAAFRPLMIAPMLSISGVASGPALIEQLSASSGLQETQAVSLLEARPIQDEIGPSVAFQAPIPPDTAPITDLAAWSPELASREDLTGTLLLSFGWSYAAIEQAAGSSLFLPARAAMFLCPTQATASAGYRTETQPVESLTLMLQWLAAPAWSPQMSSAALTGLTTLLQQMKAAITPAMSAASQTAASTLQADPLVPISVLASLPLVSLIDSAPVASSLSILLAVLSWQELAPVSDRAAWEPHFSAVEAGQLVPGDALQLAGQLAPEIRQVIDARLLASLAVLSWLEQVPVSDAPVWSNVIAAIEAGQLVPGDALQLAGLASWAERPPLVSLFRHDHLVTFLDTLTLADLLVLLNMPPFRVAPRVVLARFPSGVVLASFPSGVVLARF